MEIIKSPLQDCYLLNEKVIEDSRGYFLETYNYNYLKEKINVYNFEVEHDSTYFAEDYLVHHMCELCSGYANII